MVFKNSEAGIIISNLFDVIHENRDFLSEIDGKIGDGDHGINMDKGFTLCKGRLEGKSYSMSEGFKELGQTLLMDIGGSMGPLYGVFFDDLSRTSIGISEIDAEVFQNMIHSALDGVLDIGGAQKGDKTLLDTLIPGITAYDTKLNEGRNFLECLEALKNEAKFGYLQTEAMEAKIGRASRLGKRSIGVLDAGAASCYIILNSMVNTIEELIK